MELKELVKLIRSNAELTQEKAANILNIDTRTWERWEQGSRKPNINMLELFCIKTGQDFNKINNEKRA